ncbi:hypothetical protein A1OW_21510 [Enterovibrio norvegicus]|uniref:hypothetical protein n=1 Tax=Enterovibrio norvegicus TaxID=188144 RepID=UPI0002E38A52|nr:hypothetical protein [Enterovibrio norvegicus]OEF59698.1 hypothetical protein A1OW_21510 [Enterovibrio norvegicus]
MSAARDIAAMAPDNIIALLRDMFAGQYDNNEVALGVLLSGTEEIQVQLKVTRNPQEFIDTDFDDWDASFQPIDEQLK